MSGIFKFKKPNVLTVSGPDARDFLQRITTAHFQKSLPPAARHPSLLRGAFTRANGSCFGLFEAAFEAPHTFHLIVDDAAIEPIRRHIEEMHFGEDFVVEDRSQKFACISYLANGDVASTDDEVFSVDTEPSQLWCLPEYLISPHAWTLYFGSLERIQMMMSHALAQGQIQISDSDWHAFQVLGGRPTYSVELRADQLVLEFPLDEYVHRNKGCYPGQEVLERLYTYGNAAKFALVMNLHEGVDAGGTDQATPEVIRLENKVASFAFSDAVPSEITPRKFALAVVLRGQAKETHRFQFSGDPSHSFWTIDSTYLGSLISRRTEAKSNLLSI